MSCYLVQLYCGLLIMLSGYYLVYFFITVRLPFSLIIRYILAILLVASVLKSELPIAGLQVTSCIFLLSTTDSSVQLPLGSHKESLSLNHWATYFHQVSVGTYLNCHYFSSLQALSEEKVPEVCILAT